jgi:hypothetical protein
VPIIELSFTPENSVMKTNRHGCRVSFIIATFVRDSLPDKPIRFHSWLADLTKCQVAIYKDFSACMPVINSFLGVNEWIKRNSVFEQFRAKIALTGARQNHHNLLPFVCRTPGYFKGSPYSRPGGNPA